MAVEIVAYVESVVIQKLKDMLTQESISNEKMITSHLTAIKTTLEEANRFLDENRYDDNVKKWADDFLTSVYEVEDAIEFYAQCIARKRMRLGLLLDYLFLKNLACWLLSSKIKRIQLKTEILNSRKPNGVENAGYRLTMPELQAASPAVAANFRSVSDAAIYRDSYKQAQLVYSNSFSEEELDNIVGLREAVDTLVTRLTDGSIDASGFLSIVGETGSGKTTLARAVYGNAKIIKSFECRAWVTVSKEYDAINLYRNLLKHVGTHQDQDAPIDKQLLNSKLSERLRDRKYLIVFDDVESSCSAKDLRDALPNKTNGSIVLLITCQKQVADHASTSILWELRKLSDADGRDLLSKRAGCNLFASVELRTGNMPLRIVQACNGLPLNIVLLGSFLCAKKSAGDFDRWIEKLSKQESWKTNDILSLCYNDLSNSSKLCLLYMLLFPPELDIPVRRLLLLWQAEGFLKQPDETEISPEDAAQECFDDLVKRSLIQVSKLRSDGRPRRCRLLGVQHDFLLPKAQNVRLFHVHRRNSDACEGKSSFDVRRLVEYRDIKTCSFYQSQHRESLRSFLSFNDQKKDIPAKEVGNLLDHILRNGKPLLRVLDLEGIYKPRLPENLGDFFCLRYLGLRWTFLDALPQSVGNLYNLETLDIKHTNINTLPDSIWRLKRLRHLNLNCIHLDMPRNMPGPFPQLLTLWGLSIDQESPLKGGLKSLACLRELGITFHLSNSEQLLDWISQLSALQQLRLRSKDGMGNASNIILKPLSKLGKLSNLYLLGNLTSSLEKQDFPEGIKVLTLSVSRLQDDPMPVLGQLPCLTVLRLLANSYVGKKMTCIGGGFKKLQTLKLWMLENLDEWNVEEEAMEKLKELNIRCCNELKSLPDRLLQHKRFKELTLTNMPKECREHAEKVQKESNHFSITLKDYFKSS